jgi:hypothetical protein
MNQNAAWPLSFSKPTAARSVCQVRSLLAA